MSILKELESRLPADAGISEVKFEASEVVLYTKNPDFFRNSESCVRSIVREIKKRIEVRSDLSIVMDQEKAKEVIESIVPKEAEIDAIYFEPELGKVVIEAKKPGLVIGRAGATYREIKDQTLWLPKIERAPAIESKIVRAVRNLLHSEIDYRKKFLNKLGQDINTRTLTPEQTANEWVRMSFLGGFRQVGRSSLLLQTAQSNVMLDCGVDVGASGSEAMPYLDAPEFKMEKLDAVCLSHAHLDHSAFIPLLYERGYDGPLYATAPTRDLMVLLCMDYIDVCQKNGKEVGYTKKSIEKAVKHSVVLDYGEVNDITPDIRLTLQPAGHLLGSALTHLHIGEGLHNILYTADFKFGPTHLFDPAYKDFPRIETMIMESTYGAQQDLFPKRQEIEDNFFSIVKRTIERGGKVLIPVFAVGRAQEVMVMLAQNKELNADVYMEGMLWDATAIHTAYPEHMSQHMQRKIFHYGENPFISERFHRVHPKERDALIDSPTPCVIMATSGMLIGGPSVEYLKALAPDKRNTLVFVGYQGEGTLGSRIQKGWRELPLRGENGKTRSLNMEMEVQTISGLSGHSSRSQLISYLYNLSSKPETVIVNHGEPRKCAELARDVHKLFHCETVTPKNLESLRLR